MGHRVDIVVQDDTWALLEHIPAGEDHAQLVMARDGG